MAQLNVGGLELPPIPRHLPLSTLKVIKWRMAEEGRRQMRMQNHSVVLLQSSLDIIRGGRLLKDKRTRKADALI